MDNLDREKFLKRLGFFTMDYTWLKKWPETAMRMQSEVLIIRVEENMMINNCTYYGLSHHFQEIAPGDIVPEYKGMINPSTNEITFKRI